MGRSSRHGLRGRRRVTEPATIAIVEGWRELRGPVCVDIAACGVQASGVEQRVRSRGGVATGSAVLNRVRKRLGIQEAEQGLVTRFFLLHALMIASYTLARTTRDAVFLEELHAERLPYIYIAVAGWTAVVSAVLGRLSARQSLHRALARSLVASGLILIGFVPLFHHLPG
ncbi:MAG: hypothetical protein ACE5G2_08540, partial [Candidatus Krumholzibacteriia bacterium]